MQQLEVAFELVSLVKAEISQFFYLAPSPANKN
jgi:hypothetical protein